MNHNPSDVSESLQHIWSLWRTRTLVSTYLELYGLYLKHELQMGKNAVFSPYQWVLATIVPWHNWKKQKKKASLHCHLFYFPSFFLYVPVCRSVFAKLFLKLTTTTKPCQWLICPNRISIPLQASLMPWHIQDRSIVYEHWIIRSQM